MKAVLKKAKGRSKTALKEVEAEHGKDGTDQGTDAGGSAEAEVIGAFLSPHHPGGNPRANLKSFSHRCHPILVAFLWDLTEETIDLPLGCLQGGERSLVALLLAQTERVLY